MPGIPGKLGGGRPPAPGGGNGSPPGGGKGRPLGGIIDGIPWGPGGKGGIGGMPRPAPPRGAILVSVDHCRAMCDADANRSVIRTWKTLWELSWGSIRHAREGRRNTYKRRSRLELLLCGATSVLFFADFHIFT